MEPQIYVQEKGLAPLVGWSSFSSSLDPSPDRNYDHGYSQKKFLKNPKTKLRSFQNRSNNETKEKLLTRNKNEIGKTIKENCTSENKHNQKPKIPDGGWGWVIVFSSFLMSMIADGICFTFGILYVEFLEEFGASNSVTSWIGSLFVSVPLLTGPIMSALVERFGCRVMTIVGGIISAVGFLLSSFADSIALMYLTFGVISGLGLGVCYVTAVVSIAYWFDKRRTLAVGLGACGTGVGTFIYAPLTQYLIEELGWRGTMIILAGTLLNICVCGMLMKEPGWVIMEQKGAQSLSRKSEIDADFPNVEEIRKLLKRTEKPEYILQTLATFMESPSDNNISTNKFSRSVVNIPTFIKKSEKVPLEVLEQLSANKRLYNVIFENYPTLLTCRSTSEKSLTTVIDESSILPPTVPITMTMKLKLADKELQKQNKKKAEDDDISTDLLERTIPNEIVLPIAPHYALPPVRLDSLPLLRRDGINIQHCLHSLKLHKHSLVYRCAGLSSSNYRLMASSCPNIYRNSATILIKKTKQRWYKGIVEILKSIIDFSLFLDLHFFLMSLSTMILFTWFIVPYFYLVEHLQRNRYTDSEASVTISILGASNFVGMIGLGWAGDRPWMNVLKAYAVCLILCGVSCVAIMVFTENYTMVLVFSASFGLFFSSTYSFTPAILVELISLENFTFAYGLILLCQGIGHLIGPPIAGYIFDVTNTWEQTFWQAGIWIVISGILIFFIPYTSNKRICGSDTKTTNDECVKA
ncbi:monocarboxylate transporter 12-like isoform X2 [Agrilus planipennis]|uniref:Monocarboxylate transporter 12-like isoform X2 n=1 Tax=Agrilus planipennis TaxID=224129 RepID=A0A1W4W461_AGRPL|nr:monocarboxylate transporter 12-like isoform X2 [Agrilus planipennis]